MRRNLPAACLAAMLTIATAPASAIPPIAGGALASDNVDYVLTIPDINPIGAKLFDGYMYVTTTHGLRIYDITKGVPVLTGALAMPHWENESVDTNGGVLLISADWFVTGGFAGNILVTVDVSNKRAPVIQGITLQDDGHTATCIADCDFVWTSGMEVFDLRGGDLMPASLGRFGSGYSHNWNVDAAGIAWGRGREAYDTNGYQGSLNPQRLTIENQNAYFGWHNSIRPDADSVTPAQLANASINRGEILIGAGENLFDWWIDGGNCTNDDRVTTSWFRKMANGNYRVEVLDSWNIGADGTLPDAKPLTATWCSSHWLDYEDGLVTVAWYEQGTRILDVSNPHDIRQVGYFMPLETQAFSSYFNTVADGPLGGGTYVYTTDYVRGIDVFKIDAQAGASDTVLAPYLNPTSTALQPSEQWGWSCRIPAGASLVG